VKLTWVLVFALAFGLAGVLLSVLVSYVRWDPCASRTRGFPFPWLVEKCIVDGEKKPVGTMQTLQYGSLIVDFLFWFVVGGFITGVPAVYHSLRGK